MQIVKWFYLIHNEPTFTFICTLGCAFAWNTLQEYVRVKFITPFFTSTYSSGFNGCLRCGPMTHFCLLHRTAAVKRERGVRHQRGHIGWGAQEGSAHTCPLIHFFGNVLSFMLSSRPCSMFNFKKYSTTHHLTYLCGYWVSLEERTQCLLF